MGALLVPLFAIAVILGALALALLALFRNMLYVCPPSEVLVFSGGGARVTADGRKVGYRIVKDSQTETAGGGAEALTVDLDAELGEILVAGMRDRVGEPDLPVRFALIIANRAIRAWRRPACALTGKVELIEARFESGRGGDDFERRAGQIVFIERPIEQRATLHIIGDLPPLFIVGDIVRVE